MRIWSRGMVSIRGIFDLYVSIICLCDENVPFKCMLLNLSLRSCNLKHDKQAMRCQASDLSVRKAKSRINKMVCTVVLLLLLAADGVSVRRTCPSRPQVVSHFGHGHTRAHIGGGFVAFTSGELSPYFVNGQSSLAEACTFKFFSHVPLAEARKCVEADPILVMAQVPLSSLVEKLQIATALTILQQHDIQCKRWWTKATLQKAVRGHLCSVCEANVSLFTPFGINPVKKDRPQASVSHQDRHVFPDPLPQTPSSFPPSCPDKQLQHEIITNFCEDSSPANFQEMGCTVCGALTPIKKMCRFSDLTCSLDVLYQNRCRVTLRERHNEYSPIRQMAGPVIEPELTHICFPCREYVERGKLPRFALADGVWLGKVPKQLQDLRYAEKLLVARVRHNKCIVRVSSGMHKMSANAVSFAHPMPKIYNVLPPPIEELDEVLAFIYTGPCKPTSDDLKRTPMLVRRKKVTEALEWLKLNHADYYDLNIDYEVLKTYPENGIPVVVDYHHATSNRVPEAMSLDDDGDDDGTAEGPCSFVVHGLTGEELHKKGEHPDTMRMLAMSHLNRDGKVLAIGHSERPESLYDNLRLYPQMFPWLFPYGLGGIGNAKKSIHVSEKAHKRHLLMYYDKRFQLDPFFPIIAFNHEQIKNSTTAGFLLADKASFHDITDRLINLDTNVLNGLAHRLQNGESVKPTTEEEKACFQVMQDLDHVGKRVQGSITSKKFMRNEIWAVTAARGAPSWYITLSPADVKHPICLYFADTTQTFKPELRTEDDHFRLIAHNPVAGARFFHFMVELFIKHVLGVGSDTRGFYGDTSAYYGTVEQQGRLTLHLHLLLWLRGSFTPQEIRQRIMDPNSDFQKKLVEYLESVHVGEFLTGSHADVLYKRNVTSAHPDYEDPTQTLPEAPPAMCQADHHEDCDKCNAYDMWRSKYETTVDDLVLRSNIHVCRGTKTDDGNNVKGKPKKAVPGCKSNKWGLCKARFPRKVVPQTLVDLESGALVMKKGEEMINTLTPLVTYLVMCNTDVTSLLSGTAIKAVVSYVCDYISKTSLKTHVLFDTVRNVFEKNSELIGGSPDRRAVARKLLTQIVNSLTAQMEIGGPMASLYLLGNPDHYTNEQFKAFYWGNYVRCVRQEWNQDDAAGPEKVVLVKKNGRYEGFTELLDYIYRPKELSGVCLYDWMRLYEKDKTDTGGYVYDGEDLEEEDDYDDLDISNIHDVEHGVENEVVEYDQWFHLMRGHTQSGTHMVRLRREHKERLPTFLGGSLPKRDGDREYYCTTMLTLFKPWRTGKELKLLDQNWEDAFKLHSFSDRQLELMKFFNIRYECLDARDDYAAQRKLQADAINGSEPWYMSEEVAEMPDDVNNIVDGDIFQCDEVLLLDGSIVGQQTLNRRRNMQEIENVMKKTGWLDQSPDGIEERDVTPLQPGIMRDGESWKKIVKERRQQAFENKNKNLSSEKSKTAYNSKHQAYSIPNEVKIVDKNYIDRNYHAHNVEDNVVGNFSLNTEQERAFRIVANHVVEQTNDPLSMYLGGMGGTGKSQVIKALISFFEERGESHRFLVLAPTGAAAALLKGSTYHSVLGINEQMLDSPEALAKIRARIEGVDYIFLDEVSMVSCRDLYNISAQLAKVLNVHDKPFGGMNMIFAGDFAQLPPPGASYPLYSGTVGSKLHSGMTLSEQQGAIGKAVWHQVTTVVMLRQNMRQRTQSEADARFRTALENMRCKSCTESDIAFLCSRIAGKQPGQPHIGEKRFRNVSVITAWNAHKDQINELGCQRFAAESNQVLHQFYSVDRFKTIRKGKKTGPQTGRAQHASRTGKISPLLQKELWQLPPGASSHIPGMLSICIGMPVMIRKNEATELCITKGQEGTVAGWQCMRENPHVLDTLFVKLSNPSSDIQIDGLPLNVVPIAKVAQPAKCYLTDDTVIEITREQVPVLPNFAMTDYASQGKTRPENPVDLRNCKTHQAYYTCLSRSASATGTIILQGFDKNKIMGGASGYLRQEFRELELLDEITKLIYEGNIPPEIIKAANRNDLISQFRQWKGLQYVPPNVHPAIAWSRYRPFELPPPSTEIKWSIVKKAKKSKAGIVTANYVQADGTAALNHVAVNINGSGAQSLEPITVLDNKRKADCELSERELKKTKDSHSSSTEYNAPLGLLWDGENWSCAYDALFTILYNIWIGECNRWSPCFNNLSDLTKMLSYGFEFFRQGHCSLEDVRNAIRFRLHQQDSVLFPVGHVGTSVSELARMILEGSTSIARLTLSCEHCVQIRHMDVTSYIEPGLYGHYLNANESTETLFSNIITPQRQQCPSCINSAYKQSEVLGEPELLVMNVPQSNIVISPTIRLATGGRLCLRGIIYHGGNHFNARLFMPDGSAWFHDGITTKSTTARIQLPSSPSLNRCGEKSLSMVVYARAST